MSLINSIGAFPEEIQAYEQMKVMLGTAYGLLIIGTVLQVVLYYLYNGIYHPFACIVIDQNDDKADDDDDVESYETAVESLSSIINDCQDIFYDILYTEHIVWKLIKMSHLNFLILAIFTNFWPIKTMFDRKLQVFKN